MRERERREGRKRENEIYEREVTERGKESTTHVYIRDGREKHKGGGKERRE